MVFFNRVLNLETNLIYQCLNKAVNMKVLQLFSPQACCFQSFCWANLTSFLLHLHITVKKQIKHGWLEGRLINWNLCLMVFALRLQIHSLILGSAWKLYKFLNQAKFIIVLKLEFPLSSLLMFWNSEQCTACFQSISNDLGTRKKSIWFDDIIGDSLLTH